AVHTDYRRIKEVLAEKEIETVTGILADLGISSYQLSEPERGFSFRSGQDFTESPSSSVTSPTDQSAYPVAASPLDMRMDRSQKLIAADLVNDLSERELADIIFEYGEEVTAASSKTATS